MPKGYIYGEIEVVNPLEYEQWRASGLKLIAAFGGRFLVQRGDPRVLEGDRQVHLVMIVEFESRDRAVQWYQAMRRLRRERTRAANLHVVLLTGYSDEQLDR